jgi:hypothetical protein
VSSPYPLPCSSSVRFSFIGSPGDLDDTIARQNDVVTAVDCAMDAWLREFVA